MSATQKLFRFGVFELNITTEELRKSGTLIKLPPQPLRLLALLASRAGQIVTREEIQQQLWGEETYVDFEQGMNHCVKQIRNALNDNVDNPLYVETLPRRGYRFLAPVVSKTIPVPAPKVVESKSGIQSNISIPALTTERIAASTDPATPRAVVAATTKGPTILRPTAGPPAAAAAEVADRTVIVPRLGGRHSGLSSRVVSVAAIVIILLGAILYWQLRQQPPQLTEKDTIVLADFNNSTGEPVFDATLKQALTVDLEQSPFLNVLSDQKVDEQLRFIGISTDTRLTEDLARKVCQRAGSKALLLGSISQLGSQYVVGVQAINCETGDSLGSEQAEASSREQVLTALSKVTASLRQRLGESLASVQKYDVPVEQATTPSLEALKAYSLGIKTANTQGYAASIPYFKQAIDLDPNFAMAYARLGVEYSNLNEPGRAAENVSKAFQLRNQTSERERLYITCHYHDLVTGDVDQAIATYLLFRQAYPREQWPYINLNSLYNSIGKYDQALVEAQGALKIDPSNVGNYINLAVTYSDLNRVNEARNVLEQARAHNLDPVALLPESYVVAFLTGDLADMARQAAAAAGHPGTEDQLLAMQSDTEAYFGRLAKARELTQAAQSSAINAGLKEAATLWQLYGALHEAELGDPRRARQQADDAIAAGHSKNVQILATLAVARSGDARRAQALADELRKQYPYDTLTNGYWLPTIRAAIALSAKDTAAAIQALQPSAPYELGSPPPPIALYPVYLRGLAYLQAGQGAPAAVEFQKILDHSGIVQNFPTAALARLQLARAQALAGDTTAARHSYEDFLGLWKDADADSPVLKAAKAERAKLH